MEVRNIVQEVVIKTIPKKKKCKKAKWLSEEDLHACLLPEPGVRPKGPQDRMTCEQCAALGPAAEEAGQGG